MGHYQFTARLPQKGRRVEYVVEASTEDEALRLGAHRACQEHRVDRVEFPMVSFLGHDPLHKASPHPNSSQAKVTGSGRVKHVDRAREEWIRRLIDLSRRNNLLYYRNLQLGTVDLTNADQEAMASLLAGEAVTLSKLLPHADLVRETARAQEIRRRALANFEERGLETLFLALGMATWPPDDDGRPPEAAVVLVPVRIDPRGRDGRSMAIQRAGDPQVNLALLHVLENAFNVGLSEEELLTGHREDDEGLNLEAVFDRLKRAVREVEGFSIATRAVLGNFSFQKMAMVRDLRECGPQLAAHDLIAAIAGDQGARDTVAAARHDIDPKQLDDIPPDDEFLVLNADSSQQVVIASAHLGDSLVVQGPPGTGKSQTIANLIASFAAQGKRVLFVAEKRAALEAVFKRLQKVGLGHIALDLHGADISRRETMARLREAFDWAKESAPAPAGQLHETLVEHRKRLRSHVERLHASRPPSGLSVYDIQGRLLRLPEAARSSLKWRGNYLDRLDAQRAKEIGEALVLLGAFGGLFLRNAGTPWNGANLPDGSTVERVVDLVQEIASNRLARLDSGIALLARTLGMRKPSSLSELEQLLALLDQIRATHAAYGSGIFKADCTTIAAALSAAKKGRLAAAWALLLDGRFRAARRTLRQLRRNPKASARQLFEEASSTALQLASWRSWSPASPVPPDLPPTAELRHQLGALTRDLEEVGTRIGRPALWDVPWSELNTLFARLAADRDIAHRIPRLLELEGRLHALGAEDLIQELRETPRPPNLWPQVFQYAWLSSCLERVRAEDSEIAAFDGETHENFVRQFQELDRERLEVAAARVRREHAELLIETMNRCQDQAVLVRKEIGKRARHVPLRQLFARAPDVLTAVCPCWMASPLSVSQLLPADRQYFDVCVFDEASQVLPEDAVTSLLRASQAIVAGDRHQLPPTTFFADAGFEDTEEDELEGQATGGFESVLDVMSVFVGQKMLEWHYRSHHEALIAFSNHHIYGDRLITFPGAGTGPVLRHVLVASNANTDADQESVTAEVQRVVELVLEHARTRPRDTLGVIAMGIKHALRIQAALDATLQACADPALDEFFTENRDERFFVKNLERVQGDERDAIVISVGYGKDRSGRLLYRFGPLLYEGGERRLNVAVTRARKRITLVSSFSQLDMDPGRSTARGVELLRRYLEYAASGGKVLSGPGRTAVPLNPFESDLFEALLAAGLPLEAQWGVSKYRVDLAAKHPIKPGRFVLAIECDGASYHSSYTARDRDRLRQEHLEALGWKFHRIWSQDWFYRREGEVRRARQAYEEAVLLANREDEESSAPAQDPTVQDPEPLADSSFGEATPPTRGRRPPVRKHETIDAYSIREVVSIVEWIKSDGRLRTRDELLEEVIRELGFARRGKKIVDLVMRAIDRARTT
jgi:very-short-patch-repair endonuclease